MGASRHRARLSRIRRSAVAAIARLLLVLIPAGAVQAAGVGDDLAAAFARARGGAPLRYVAMGGSITQAGGGWLGPWLRERFPASAVTVINAGMSATGSTLGMFRLERDVIAHQPDVVALEFCVNDGGEDEAQVVRAMETLVVRLKRLPHPPAVFVIESAARRGVDAARHRRVAAHYGLLSIDLQAAADRALKEGATWDALFSDDVHPRDPGHALYARALADALAPFADRPAETSPAVALPAPLSALPLLLDARMVPLIGLDPPGWHARPAPPEWWGRFFQGLQEADALGSTLTLRQRGTAFGLLHILDERHGRLLTSVDGAVPRVVALDGRSGYAASMLAMDLPPGEHGIACVLPELPGLALGAGRGTTVQLGYLLVAGDSGPATAVAAGPWNAAALAGLRFAPLAAGAWSWSGPYASAAAGGGVDAATLMREAFLPERSPATVTWSALPPADGDWIDLAAVRRDAAPAVAYCTANVESAADRQALMAFAADYFAQVWVNDEPVLTLDGGHGPPRQPLLVPVALRGGSNAVRVKIGSGSGGFGFALAIAR